MDDSRYLECLSSDYASLRDAAAATELTAPVPCCPGWTMGDLVSHVALVYLHKATSMRTGQIPESWPPPGLDEEPLLPLLDRTYGELMAEFSQRAPADPTPTWYEPDQTVAFWIRRMAQETVIHRIDAEQTAGLPVTPVPEGCPSRTGPLTTRGSRSRRRPRRCCAGCGGGPPTMPSRSPATRSGPPTCAACWPKSPSRTYRRRAGGSCTAASGARSRNSAYVSGARSVSTRPRESRSAVACWLA